MPRKKMKKKDTKRVPKTVVRLQTARTAIGVAIALYVGWQKYREGTLFQPSEW